MKNTAHRSAAWAFRLGTASGLAAILLLSAGAAYAAVQIDANVEGVYTDLSFTTPTSAVLWGGDSFGGLSVGDGVVIEIDVSNPDAHDVQAIFLTLAVDPDKLDFISGTFTRSILAEATPFGVDFLTAVDPSPTFKIDDPTSFTLHGIAHANPFGTAGPGPDLGTARLEFQVLNDSTTIEVALEVGSSDGLLIDATPVDESNVSALPDLVQLDSATLYLPEPQTHLALVAGLAALVLVDRRRRQRGDRRSSAQCRTSGRRSMPALLVSSILLAASAASAQVVDSDGDFVPDLFDNCVFQPNGPLQANQQADTDQDGFGDACDADYDQDGYVLGADIIYWIQNCLGTFNVAACDLRANGTGGDSLTYATIAGRFNDEVGPSGLFCATIPPVDVANGDPPCLP